MTPRARTPATAGTPLAWDSQLQDVARSLPAVLEGLRTSYRELEERAARIERELHESNRQLAEANRERSELAERLHASDKLSALGTLAAGIAHEIRNPLNAVHGFAELLAGRERDDERSRRWTQHIVEGVREVDAIVDNLLSFGGPQRLRLEAIDARELLEGAVRLAESGFEAPERTRIDVRAEAPAFLGDRIKLRQAVRNLLANAVEAQADVREPRVAAELVLEQGELCLRVSDAGPGVAAELRTRILDPFFTTHADGTGLGLALVSVIARLHGGTVQCAPRPSALGGALFVLRIPFQPADRPDSLPQPQRTS